MGESTPEKTGFFKEVLEEIKKNPQRGAIDFNTRVGLKDKKDLIALHNLSISEI